MTPAERVKARNYRLLAGFGKHEYPLKYPLFMQMIRAIESISRSRQGIVRVHSVITVRILQTDIRIYSRETY